MGRHRAAFHPQHGAPRITQITDPASRNYIYGYDSSTGELTSYQDPQNGASAKTLYGYTGANLTSITTPRGLQVALTYDASRRVKTVTYSCPMAICNPVKTHQWQFTYNSDNTVVKDPNLNSVTYQYDGASRVKKITDAYGKDATLTYNEDNNVKNAFDPLANVLQERESWRAIYEPGEPEQFPGVTQPWNSDTGAAFTKYTYDSSRTDFERYFPTSVKNGTNPVWNFDYNCKHDLKTASDTIGNTFTYHYFNGCTGDGDQPGTTGLPYSITDARTKVTYFDYTFTGSQLTSETVTPPSPLNPVTLNFEATTGRVTSVVLGNDHKRVFTYDNLDRVTRVDFYAHSADPTPTSSITYTYDGDGNLTQRVDNTGTSTFQYKDPYGRQTRKDIGSTTFIYTYDGVNLKTLTDAGGMTTYNYNSRNLLTSVAANGITTNFEYDWAGNRVYTKFSSASSVRQYVRYDMAGRVCNIAVSTTVLTKDSKDRYMASCTDTVSGTILGNKYVYDDPGTAGKDTLLRQSVTDKDGNKATYHYDADLRLDQVTNTGSPMNIFTYSYDGNGNMTSLQNNNPSSTTWFVYNDASELCWSGTTTPPANCSTANYTYDGSGNELTSPKYTFTYNEKEQTTSVTPTGSSATSMTYANAGQGQRTTWDGHTYTNGGLGLDKDVFGSTTVYYNHEPSGALIGERIGSASYYYATDGLGSVMGVFDATTSATKNTYKYDPWGVETSKTEAVYNRWRYGQGFADEYNGTSTLMKFGERYYDSSTMRWTQPDPLGGGYLYAGDNPVNATDPSGLREGVQAYQPCSVCSSVFRGVGRIGTHVAPVGMPPGTDPWVPGAGPSQSGGGGGGGGGGYSAPGPIPGGITVPGPGVTAVQGLSLGATAQGFELTHCDFVDLAAGGIGSAVGIGIHAIFDEAAAGSWFTFPLAADVLIVANVLAVHFQCRAG